MRLLKSRGLWQKIIHNPRVNWALIGFPARPPSSVLAFPQSTRGFIFRRAVLRSGGMGATLGEKLTGVRHVLGKTVASSSRVRLASLRCLRHAFENRFERIAGRARPLPRLPSRLG